MSKRGRSVPHKLPVRTKILLAQNVTGRACFVYHKERDQFVDNLYKEAGGGQENLPKTPSYLRNPENPEACPPASGTH